MIDVFSNGEVKRHFTYIDDIVEGVIRVANTISSPQKSKIITSSALYKFYNVGNNQPVSLRRFLAAIETACGNKAKENLMSM